MSNADTLTALRKDATALSALMRDTHVAYRDATSYHEQGVSPERLKELRASAKTQVTSRFDEQSKPLLAGLSLYTGLLERAATAARPTFDKGTLDTAWQGVKARLDAGMSLPMALNRASLEEAEAIRTYGPAWLDAAAFTAQRGNGHMGAHTPPDVDALNRAIDARIADQLRATGKGDAADAISGHREALALRAQIDPVHTNLRHMFDGTPGANGASGLHAAVAGALGAQDARNTSIPAPSQGEPAPAA